MHISLQPGVKPRSLMHVFSTFAVGGPQVRFSAFANRSAGAFRHTVIAMDGRYEARELLDTDLDVSFPTVSFRKKNTLTNVLKFRDTLNTLQPATLVTYNWGSIEWAIANLGLSLQHVHIEDGFGPEESVTQLRRRVLTRRISLRESITIVPSENLRRIACDVWKLPEHRVHHIPNGIDLRRFSPRPVRGVPPCEPVIGTVSALRAEKNLVRLLHAFRAVLQSKAAWLVIAGDGPERERLMATAQELGIHERVRFTGHIAAPEQIYPEFDIFALSSDTEQMPLSVLEAMASGLPIAATNVGDISLMVSDANRRFLVHRDEAALAGAIGELVHDAALRQAIGTANCDRVRQKYDQEVMFQAYTQFLNGTTA